MSYALALVDFDGTLADSMPYWLSLPVNTLREFGIPQPEGFTDFIRSIPMHEIAEKLSERYPELEAEKPLRERWQAQMAEYYAHDIPLKSDALKLLDTLRAHGLKVFILSATYHELLDPAIRRLDVLSHADGVYSEQECGSKRTAEPYEFFRDTFGVPFEKMLLAEDAPRNLAAAEALGIAGVGVYDESMKEYNAEIRAGAAVYLEDFTDLSALEKLLEE